MKKIKSIDYLKGIMALGIVLFHYNKFTGTAHNDVNFPLFELFEIFYVNGGILVELFFMISGFCFFEFYSKKIINNEITKEQFFKRRFFRLYPLYMITTIIIVVLQIIYSKVYGSFFDAGVKLDWLNIILNLFCLSRGYVNNVFYPYNGPAWFLNVIILDYILFYLINRYVKSTKKKVSIMLVIIIFGIALKYFDMQLPVLNVEVGRGLFNFFIGGILTYIYEIVKEKNFIRNFLTIVLLIIMISVVIFLKSSYYANVLLLFPAMFLFFILIDKYIPYSKILENLGKISFSMYLWHYCYMCFIKLIPFNFNYYSNFFLMFYLITLILLSYFSYVFIEEKLGRKLEGNKQK